MSLTERFFGSVDVNLDDEGFPSNSTEDAFHALRTKSKKMKAVLWNKVPCGKSARTRQSHEFTPVPMNSSSAVSSYFTIKLEDQEIVLPILHFGLVKKFHMNFKSDPMSVECFEKKYLIPAINDWDSAIDLESLPFITYPSGIFRSTKENDVEFFFKTNMIMPIADLQQANLQNQFNFQMFKKQYFRFCKDKLKAISTKVANPRYVDDVLPYSDFQMNLKGIGLSLIPDYSIGYLNDSTLLLPIGLGEIKTPRSGLGETYEILKKGRLTFLNQTYENIEFDLDMNKSIIGSSQEGFSPTPNSMIKTFNNTVSKLISTMIHSGVPKGFISDYDNTIFIHLDENFKVKAEASVFKVGNSTERRFVVEGNHILIKSTSNKLRAYIASFFWTSSETFLAQERFRANVTKWFDSHDTDKDVGGAEGLGYDKDSNKDANKKAKTNEGSSRSTKNQAQLQHPKKDSDSGEGSSKKLKGNQGQPLNRDTTLLESQHKEGGKDAEEVGGSATPLNEAEISYIGSDATNSTDSTFVNSSYQINLGMFTKIIPLEMEKLIYEFLKYDLGNYSSNTIICLKVATVKLREFIECIPSENRCLFEKDTKNILSRRTRQKFPHKGILKVYDTTIETYQQYVQKCYQELKIYEKLRTGMGKYIPELHAGGLLHDKTIKIGSLYLRLNGPFMLLEHLTKMPNFNKDDVTREIFNDEILPCFKFIHGLGVVHNDVKMENFVFIRKGLSRKVTCKLIDFSESFSTDKRKYFDEEILEVFRTFHMPITD